MMRGEYYTIITVSLTSLIPVIYGIIFSFIYSEDYKNVSHIFGISYKGIRITADLLRMINLFLITFISLFLFIRLSDPVPSEAWLRTLFVMVLLSAESLVVYSLIRLSSAGLSRIYLILIVMLIFVALPAGLLLHKPWIYFLFISPFYWLGWTWIIPSAGESEVYSSIAVFLTILWVIVARFFFRIRKAD